ncbi:MAG: histidine phosphatase family protein [Nannocystaceae bacterium]|nr:histidine phosphatase family protein [Nannocystaceae bacterium]
MGTLVVVRHGQASLFAADYDVLSPRGMAQAEFLGAYLREHGPPPQLVFTGPAQRQRETARLCGEAYAAGGRAWPEALVVPELDEHDAFGLVARAVPRLQHDAEVAALAQAASAAVDAKQRSGSFQRLFEAIMVRWLRGELDGLDAPGEPPIESWPSFAARVQRGLERILDHDAPGIRILAFTSVGPIAVLLQRALATGDRESFQTAWRTRNSAMTTFVFSRARERGTATAAFTLDGFNALPHLPDASAHTFR